MSEVELLEHLWGGEGGQVDRTVADARSSGLCEGLNWLSMCGGGRWIGQLLPDPQVRRQVGLDEHLWGGVAGGEDRG